MLPLAVVLVALLAALYPPLGPTCTVPLGPLHVAHAPKTPTAVQRRNHAVPTPSKMISQQTCTHPYNYSLIVFIWFPGFQVPECILADTGPQSRSLPENIINNSQEFLWNVSSAC